jgi:hypothetical protein
MNFVMGFIGDRGGRFRQRNYNPLSQYGKEKSRQLNGGFQKFFQSSASQTNLIIAGEPDGALALLCASVRRDRGPDPAA